MATQSSVCRLQMGRAALEQLALEVQATHSSSVVLHAGVPPVHAVVLVAVH